MKRSELKELIKPLVKECVQESVSEILLESGLLSTVITEVLKGTVAAQTIVESPKKPPTNNMARNNPVVSEAMNALRQDREQMINEMKQKSKNISMKIGGVDVFRDTEPLLTEAKETSVADPLSGVSPGDPGVDISRLTSSGRFKMIK